MRPCREPDKEQRYKRMVMADDARVFLEYSGLAADRQGVLNAAA
ncbi:hypothetical protein MKZ24_01100 [Paenibacillus sp. FSL R7-0297]